MIQEKEINKKMITEEYPNCKEHTKKGIDKEIGSKIFRFCSQACAEAYKETNRRYGEIIREKVGNKNIIALLPPRL